jgi:hypothetical protein
MRCRATVNPSTITAPLTVSALMSFGAVDQSSSSSSLRFLDRIPNAGLLQSASADSYTRGRSTQAVIGATAIDEPVN